MVSEAEKEKTDPKTEIKGDKANSKEQVPSLKANKKQEKAEKQESSSQASASKEKTQKEGKTEAPDKFKKDSHKKEAEALRRKTGNDGIRPFAGANQRFRPRRRILDSRKITIDYKKSAVLERFISKTGKILPRRVTGASALLQRKIAREIKRARHIGLLPYSDR